MAVGSSTRVLLNRGVTHPSPESVTNSLLMMKLVLRIRISILKKLKNCVNDVILSDLDSMGFNN